nr:hydratase [Lachnospiraceae bacterium]
MIKLSDGGSFLLNQTELKGESQISREEAAKNTIAYRILQAHNISGDEKHLQIRFDKLTSHDITFVGIIQTARASGL